MVTLTFIALVLLPIVAPSLIALLGLLALCMAPSVRIVETRSNSDVATENSEALELGLALVEETVWVRKAPVYTLVDLREPTMADALFGGMADYNRKNYNPTVMLYT